MEIILQLPDSVKVWGERDIGTFDIAITDAKLFPSFKGQHLTLDIGHVNKVIVSNSVDCLLQISNCEWLIAEHSQNPLLWP